MYLLFVETHYTFVIFKINIKMYAFVEACILINMCYKRLLLNKEN